MVSSSSKLGASIFILAASAGALLQCSSGDSGAGGGTNGPDATVGGDSGGGTDAGGGRDGTAPGTDGGADVVTPIDTGTACNSAAQCGSSATAACCSGVCTDTAHDPQNCGACAVACQKAQFCTGVRCEDAVFTHVLDNPAVTLVYNTVKYAPDDQAGARIGAAMVAVSGQIDGGKAIVFTQQPFEADAIDPNTGAPNLGVGDTYLAGGSWYGHPGLAYMDDAGLTTVQVNTDGKPTGNSWIWRLSDHSKIVDVPTSTLTASHDYFILELAVEPKSGTLCFAAIGMLGPGTQAAAYWAVSTVIPNRATYTDAWYVYEWLNTDADPAPSAGDTFTLKASGK